MDHKLLPAIFAAWLLLFASTQATTICKGPDLTVTQLDDEPETVTDVLIPGVASLGRGFVGALCNTEVSDVCSSGNRTIPTDFEFAFSNLNGNPAISYGSAENFADFTFANLFTSLNEKLGDNLPPRNPGPVSGVGRIVSADVYFDIEFLSWQGNRGGGFSYRRSTVPEPTTFLLAAVGICLSMSRQRR